MASVPTQIMCTRLTELAPGLRGMTEAKASWVRELRGGSAPVGRPLGNVKVMVAQLQASPRPWDLHFARGLARLQKSCYLRVVESQ